jgi:hypothetical protein
MRSALRLAAWALVCVALAPTLAYAQASITGTVRDSSGAVLPGVTVEASSSALIEKVRSVVTDSGGVYRIVDLRPGTYAVTFTLPGFNVVKQEGIELTGSFAATVNAELRVGAVQETVTVSAQAPIVDISNTTQQRVFDQAVIEAIPAGRSHINMAVLIPGLAASQPGRGALQDVGGTNNLQNTTFVIHGSRQADTRLQLDGVRVGNVLSEGQFSNFVPDTGMTQEVTIDYAAVSAEQPFGGLRINLIPKEGGNSFKGSLFATGVNSAWQGSNIDDDLKTRGLGLPDPNEMKRAYDVNPSIGGPLMRDKLWFFFSARWQDNESFVAGLYQNRNAGDPSKWVPDSPRDLDARGVFRVVQKGVNLRLTSQLAPKHKLSLYYDNQGRIWDDSRPSISPESTVAYRFPVLRLAQAAWTSTLTSKLLVEARFANRGEAFGNQYPEEGSIYRELIPVIEQTTSLQYRGKGGDGGSSALFAYSTQKINTATGAVSYVTGSHSFKFGASDTWASTRSSTKTNTSALLYRFTAGIPQQLTMYAPVEGGTGSKVIGEIGLFAQDRWTIDRVTLNLGIRYDQYLGGYPDQHLGPALYQPNRDFDFAAVTTQNFKDVTPRAAVAYDLFGNGKTALKVNYGKYVLAQATVGNPAGLVVMTNRSWNDSFYPAGDPRRGNFVPDCDLLNPALNAECGPWSAQNFGARTSATAFDERTRFGWSNRPWSAEFSTSVQHELMPRLGVDVGYFRRWYGNFIAADNLANTAADFDTYSITAPRDSRLPDGGGYVVSGLKNINPSRFGQNNQFNTLAKDFGKQIEHWNGVDVSLNARMANGVTLQGGFSTGRTTTDNCDIARTAGTTSTAFGILLTDNPTELYCHNVQDFLTQVKGLATYTVPKVDLNVAATIQSSPGALLMANYQATNAEVQPSLGRPLAGGAASVIPGINLVEPGTLFGDRLTQLDLRFSRSVRFSGRRLALNLDIYNALNANPIIQYNNNFAIVPTATVNGVVQSNVNVWLSPQRIMEARLFKVSGQLDF